MSNKCKKCKNVSEICPDCGEPCVLGNTYVNYFEPDIQPFCGKDCEDNRIEDIIIEHEIAIHVSYCPRCNKKVSLWANEEIKEG
jgi:hypothetical protein